MSKIKYLTGQDADGKSVERQYAAILCPACGYSHHMGIGPFAHGDKWTFNGDDDKPVFSPSLLMRSMQWHPPVTAENLAEWKANPWPQEQRLSVCHSYVGCNGAQPGEIVFLGDCTHALAGQTVPLPDHPAPRHVAPSDLFNGA